MPISAVKQSDSVTCVCVCILFLYYFLSWSALCKRGCQGHIDYDMNGTLTGLRDVTLEMRIFNQSVHKLNESAKIGSLGGCGIGG